MLTKRKIFGFKHTLKNNVIELDPSDQTNATLRYRLFARSIRINGVAQISRLQKHLQLRLDRTCREYLDAQISGEGLSVFVIDRAFLLTVV